MINIGPLRLSERARTGERVVVQFRDRDVLIASICDPSIGFSLAGRRHCAGHREFVRQVVVPIPR